MNQLKKNFLISVFAALSLVGCGEKAKEEKVNTVKHVETVVALLPTTGYLAFLGEPGQKAIKLALEDIAHNQGGVPFSVEIVDTKGDPKEAVTRYMETKEKYNAKIFITTLTGVSEALKPMIEKDGGLQLVVAIHPKLMENSKNAIRFCFNAAQEAREISDRLTKNKKETIGLLVSKDATSVSEFDDYLIPALKAAQMTYSRQDYDVGQKDFRTALLSLKSKNISKLVVLGYGSDLPAILKQLANIDPKGKISVTGGIGLIEFPDWVSADYLNRQFDFVGPTLAVDGLVATQTNPIAKRYSEKFGTKYMPYDAAFTYDAVSALSTAFGQGAMEAAQIHDKIISWKTYRGSVGEITFSADGDVTSSMSWARYLNGKFVKGAE